MSGLLIVIGIIALIAIPTIIFAKYEKKRLKTSNEKHQKRLSDELSDEQAKPKSYIKVTAFDGEQFYTSKFDPRYRYNFMSIGNGYTTLESSRSLAEDYVHNSYKDGYFEFGDRSIPVRVIKEVEILSE